MLRFSASIRDHLSPWLIVAIASVALLPLMLVAGCEIACTLGVMPGGACSHTGFSHNHGHFTGELVSGLPFVQGALAGIVLLGVMLTLVALSSANPVLVRAELVREDREGTRLRI